MARICNEDTDMVPEMDALREISHTSQARRFCININEVSGIVRIAGTIG